MNFDLGSGGLDNLVQMLSTLESATPGFSAAACAAATQGLLTANEHVDELLLKLLRRVAVNMVGT